MSFLRIRSPYHEPRDIPLGPSVGRRTQSRLGIRGGSGNPVLVGALVTGSSKYSGRVDKRVGQHSPKVRPVCGKTLRILGGTCARRPGHAWDCQSAERLAKMAEGRRSGVGRWP